MFECMWSQVERRRFTYAFVDTRSHSTHGAPFRHRQERKRGSRRQDAKATAGGAHHEAHHHEDKHRRRSHHAHHEDKHRSSSQHDEDSRQASTSHNASRQSRTRSAAEPSQKRDKADKGDKAQTVAKAKADRHADSARSRQAAVTIQSHWRRHQAQQALSSRRERHRDTDEKVARIQAGMLHCVAASHVC